MHKTVKLLDPFDEYYVNIDKNIAPLIYELWKAGINIANACEDNDSMYENDACIWIEFWDDQNFYKFLNILFFGEPTNTDFYKRGQQSHIHHKFKWNYYTCIDTKIVENNKMFIKHNLVDNAYVSHGVRFPRLDYAEVLKRVCEYNSLYDTECTYEKIIKSHNKMKNLFIKN